MAARKEIYPIGGSSRGESAYQCRKRKRHRFSLWVGKIPWRRAWLPSPVFLPGESPWPEEPDGLKSIASQRVRYNQNDLAQRAPLVLCLVAQSCPTLCNSMDCSLPGSSGYGDSPGKNAGVGSHAVLHCTTSKGIVVRECLNSVAGSLAPPECSPAQGCRDAAMGDSGADAFCVFHRIIHTMSYIHNQELSGGMSSLYLLSELMPMLHMKYIKVLLGWR